MPSRCFVCRLKRKRCVQLPNHLSCTACQRLRVECMSCIIEIPNAVRESTEARECLEEANALASGDPGRVELAPLPKTRQFLSNLQSNLRDTATLPLADLRIPATTSIFSPTAVPPNATHEWENRVDTVSAFGVSAAVLPINDLGYMPPINSEASSSILGSSGYVRTVDEANLLHVGSLPYPAHIPNPEATIPLNGAICSDLAPQPTTPNHETVSYGENRNLPQMSDNSHIAVNYGSAGLSTVPYPQLDASLHETRAETLGNGANWDQDAVDWLRGLAWSMGYHLVPRRAVISSGGALV
ncbi:uncharacterized protein EI90DRAFT_3038478 [Cantharellus anzutake]|uniref:uncharacterized protein n=1 Tax=Cantharellus anzutake TaxID=1750568 RepID=UPI0019062E79|nr:uncharacterized protein EI90DRAFT_3038478 [Cantharellus anzutake]KAF8339938.1 hypothetical protein EI90DRAFT_3038478 [Cantharellus anzutake]